MNKYTKLVIGFMMAVTFAVVLPYTIVNAQLNLDDVVEHVIIDNGADDVSGSQGSIVNGPDDVGQIVNTGTCINGCDDVGLTTNLSGNGADDVANSATQISDTGTVTNPPINGFDDENQIIIPVNPPVDPTPTPIISGGGSSSSGSRSMFFAPVIATSTGTCSYLNDYLRIDWKNDVTEVTKLQLFLKNMEKLDVDINGVFDNKTFEAVKAFQAKYLNETMSPWGSNNPTGQVFYTTKKKINEIFCNTTLYLTPEQIAQIQAYKNGISNSLIVNNVNNNSNNNSNSPVGINISGSDILSSSSIPFTPEIGSNDNENQTANVADAGFFGKIWNFIKWLFGY